MEMIFVPAWIRFWYLANIVILIPDWSFVVLRPRSMEGGDLAYLFRLFIIYGRVDKLYVDCRDKTLKYIALLGGWDILACCYLFAFFKPDDPWFAIACICREAFVLTKTLLYVLYGYEFIVPKWRLPVTVMNSQWCIIPAVSIYQIAKYLVNGLQSVSLM